jgi:photosystem II stability/assembly factor-like uncharacterized protein
MNKTILFALYMVLITSSTHSQNIWELNLNIPGNHATTIVSLDENNCYVLAGTGTNYLNIFHSVNKGENWDVLYSKKYYLTLYQLSIPDSLHHFIACNNSTILKSTDGGKNFTELIIDGINQIRGISMLTQDVGAIANQSILITKDGWKTNSDFKMEIDNMSFAYHYPHFKNDSMLYAIVRVFDQREPNVQYYTNHSLMKLNINTMEYKLFYIDHLSGIRDFFVLNERILFSCGTSNTISGGTCHDAVYKSTDSGETWSRMLDLYSHRNKFYGHDIEPFGLQSVAFKDSLTGIAVGQFGKIVYTYDGGESWTYESKLHDSIRKTTPPTMLVRYADTIPIVATFTGYIYRMIEDNLVPGLEHKYSISGRVWEGDKGQAGIPISLDTFRVTMTDKDGYYRFGNLKEGTYQVRALNKYYDGGNPTYYYKPFDYTPLEYNIDLTSDTSGFDFNAEDLRTFYKAEGYIVDDKGQGVPDIFLRTGSSTTTTDDSGRFEFPKIESRLTFDVIPYSEELTFSPSSHRINLITGDTTDLLFTATPATSVWESASSSSLFLHPNPASEYIEINMDSWTPPARWSPFAEIKIFNTLGECVNLTPTLSEGEGVRIDVSHLPRGVYYVRIGNKTEMFVKM